MRKITRYVIFPLYLYISSIIYEMCYVEVTSKAQT